MFSMRGNSMVHPGTPIGVYRLTTKPPVLPLWHPTPPSLRRIQHLPQKYHTNRQSSRTKKEALPDLQICYAEASARYQEAAKETQVGFFRCFEKRGWKLMLVWFCRGCWMLLRSMLWLTRLSIMLSRVWTIL